MKGVGQVLFLLVIFITNCSETKEAKRLDTAISIKTSVEIPDIIVDKSSIQYDRSISVWSLNGEPYSGHIVSFHQDSTLKGKTGILNGKKQNQSRQWYPDGQLKQIANYHKGKIITSAFLCLLS